MKRKLCTILLVALMLMGSMPVFAEEVKLEKMPGTFAEIKEAFPQARIIDHAAKFVPQRNDSDKIVMLDLDYAEPDAVPIEIYSRETENGVADLYVFEDGSYYLLGFEIIDDLPFDEQNGARGTGFEIISSGSPITGKASYTGASYESLSFRIQYHESASIFCSNPSHTGYTGPLGLHYIYHASGRRSSNTIGFLEVEAGTYYMDPITGLPSTFQRENYVQLIANRNAPYKTPTVQRRVSYSSY